ncbi:rRNA methyltransferase 1, mitochondrial-like isoform X2 [Acanthaster planci]|uniref:rRNA methyltransferase 1, mitochondrial n=1 Tax=Acanthaster planci TaxID=133434 RepID=A0A8B7ZKQ4_ACAPL|nr:rRNA methyltransferase 1, mitochondrial-like isoform X2 [Acanthaster planci]
MGNHLFTNKCVQFSEYSLKSSVISYGIWQSVRVFATRTNTLMSSCTFCMLKRRKCTLYLWNIKKPYSSDIKSNMDNELVRSEEANRFLNSKHECNKMDSGKNTSKHEPVSINNGYDQSTCHSVKDNLDAAANVASTETEHLDFRLGEGHDAIAEAASDESCDNNLGRSGDLLQNTDLSVAGLGSRKTVRQYTCSKKRSQLRNETLTPPPGADILYGISPCLLALEARRRQVNKVYVTPSFVKSTRPEAQEIMKRIHEQALRGHTYEVHRKELDLLTKRRPHQGICLETSRIHFEPLPEDLNNDDEKLQHPPVYLAMDQILDPMNMGAIIRSAYYLGVDKIIASKQHCCSLTPVVSKASSGVMEVMPVYATRSILTFIQKQKDNGWEIAGSTSASGNGHFKHTMNVCGAASFLLNKPTVLVIGGEGSGLSDSIQNECCQLLTIPAGRQLHAGIDSLNVSVATGILLQSILLQRSPQPSRP